MCLRPCWPAIKGEKVHHIEEGKTSPWLSHLLIGSNHSFGCMLDVLDVNAVESEATVGATIGCSGTPRVCSG
jgi:hypothetical protein